MNRWIDERTDFYPLGVVLYEMPTGASCRSGPAILLSGSYAAYIAQKPVPAYRARPGSNLRSCRKSCSCCSPRPPTSVTRKVLACGTIWTSARQKGRTSGAIRALRARGARDVSGPAPGAAAAPYGGERGGGGASRRVRAGGGAGPARAGAGVGLLGQRSVVAGRRAAPADSAGSGAFFLAGQVRSNREGPPHQVAGHQAFSAARREISARAGGAGRGLETALPGGPWGRGQAARRCAPRRCGSSSAGSRSSPSCRSPSGRRAGFSHGAPARRRGVRPERAPRGGLPRRSAVGGLRQPPPPRAARHVHRDGVSAGLIGATRDNEVGPAHPLRLALAECAGSAAPPSPRYRPRAALARARSWSSSPIGPRARATSRCKPPAQLASVKIGWKPFFVLQFLIDAAPGGRAQRLLDFEEPRWRWDIAAIRDKGFTDNVGDHDPRRYLSLLRPGRLHFRTCSKPEVGANLAQR